MKSKIIKWLIFASAGVFFFLLFTTACKDPQPPLPPNPSKQEIPGMDEVRDNVITLVTEKPIGSTIAFGLRLDTLCNMPLMVEGLKDGFLQQKKDRKYWVYTITSPVIKLIGPIQAFWCAPPTDEDLMPLEENNLVKSIVVSPTQFLTNLNCDYSSFHSRTGEYGILEYVDVSKAPNLEYFLIGYNRVTHLDVTKNEKLYSFYCSSNRLTSLDLSHNKAIETLCISNNKLGEIDLSSLSLLESLQCIDCNLTKLDLRNNYRLEMLYASNNVLTSLDVRNSPHLYHLAAEHNQLREFIGNPQGELAYLDVSQNRFSILDLTTFSSLQELYCYNNQLFKLDFSKNTKVFKISCFNNNIRGNAMTRMLQTLPKNKGKGYIALIKPSSDKEQNRCKKSDVAIAKERNWDCLQSINPRDDYFSIYGDTKPYEGED